MGYRLQLASRSTFAPGTLLVDVPESGTEAHAPLMDFPTAVVHPGVRPQHERSRSVCPPRRWPYG